MACITNTHIKSIFISLITCTLIITIIFYYFGLYKLNTVQVQFIKLKEIESNIKPMNKTTFEMKTLARKRPSPQVSKFIVYECRGWCGGFADRLKGTDYFIYLKK